jgi:carboxypeptidase C (cathepsin A)
LSSAQKKKLPDDLQWLFYCQCAQSLYILAMISSFARFTLYALLLLPISAQEKPSTEKTKEDGKKNESVSTAKDVTTEGSVIIEGKKIPYKTTTGKITLFKDDATPRASIFHVSYIRADVDSAKRPVTFAFNGGPGSSAVWLHLGALGPRIIQFPGDGTQPISPPAQWGNNAASILDVSDLVFIDPVSTGYSRAEKDTKPGDFHGVDEDIESVGDFIRMWVTKNKRWQSAKFLLGESYGGVRAAGLSHFLQSRYAMSLNGVVMLSTLMDFQTLSPAGGNDLAYQVFLPTMTSVAHYHGVIQGSRDELITKSRAFAFGPYVNALQQGNQLPEAEKKAMASQLAALTGLPSPLIEQLNLRIDPSRFRGELLKSKGKVIGRFDARVAWDDMDASESHADYDPSYSLAYGAFGTAMLGYLTSELDWQENQPYEILTGKVHPWRWNASNGYVNLTGKLASAMRDNPKLRVLVQCGNTDLATPSDGMLYSTRQMLALPAEFQKNITFTWYEGGHMFYLNPPDLKKMRKDLVEFITAQPQP